MNILQSIGNMLLQRKLKRRIRHKVMCDLDGAKTVGILFTADSAVTYDRIIQLVNEFTEKRNIKVLSIGYVENKKQLDLFTEQTGFRFYSAKQSNWFGRPKDHSVDFFIEKEFDIFLDLSLTDDISIDYIVGMSKSKFKVGRLKPNNRIYDMMIDIQKNNTLEYFITQIEVYLSMFKVKHNTKA